MRSPICKSVFSFLFLALVGWTGMPVARGQSVGGNDAIAKSGSSVRQAFAELAAPVARSTVSVLIDGRQAALGVIVTPEGHLLTKASELNGPIQVRSSDGRLFSAELVGAAVEHDVAMLRVTGRVGGDARAVQFTSLPFSDDPDIEVGRIVAAVGVARTPLAVGVISVARRMIPADVVMGVLLQDHLDGAGAKVMEVSRNSGAQAAGMRRDDVIVSIDDQPVANRGDVTVLLAKRSPGQSVTVRVRRDEGDVDLDVRLTLRTAPSPRTARQNRMGGRLSDRRGGFAAVLQHDMVTIDPTQCGSAIITLDGQVAGLNIARAGRTETYAIPAQVVARLIPELLAGKHPPTTNPADRAVEAPTTSPATAPAGKP